MLSQPCNEVRTVRFLHSLSLLGSSPNDIVHRQMSTTLPGFVRGRRVGRAIPRSYCLTGRPLPSCHMGCRGRGGCSRVVLFCSFRTSLCAELLLPALQTLPRSALVRRNGDPRRVEHVCDETPVERVSLHGVPEKSVFRRSPHNGLIVMVSVTFTDIPGRRGQEHRMTRGHVWPVPCTLEERYNSCSAT